MIDIDGWNHIETDNSEVFGRYEHTLTQITISIRQGDDWPDSVAVVVAANNESEVLCQKELTPDAMQVASEYIRLIQFSCDIGDLGISNSQHSAGSC